MHATPPTAPSSPNPTDGATGVNTAPTLNWSASGAKSFDVSFGTSSPPPQVSTGQAAASYAPGNLAAGTTYFWQVVARNDAGSTTGAVWSFTTAAAPPPPAAPTAPNPSNGATGVSTTPTLTWSASGATSYDVSFGTSSPPPQVATGQPSPPYAAGNLAAGTAYFWQVV